MIENKVFNLKYLNVGKLTWYPIKTNFLCIYIIEPSNVSGSPYDKPLGQ